MTRMTWSRILAQFRSRRLDRDLDDEVAFHLAMLEDEFRGRGMAPREAAGAARREFGGVAQTQERYRERRGLPWLETTWKDIRYALRGLRRTPGFTAAAVLSLALGIGANTAVFSLFYTLMVRSLPVARPQELVSLYKTGGWGKGFASYPLYAELANRKDLFQGVLGKAGPVEMKMDASGSAWCEFATGNYFSVLGVKPALGRLLHQDDERGAGSTAAVLSHDFWIRRFGGDPRVIGRTLVIRRWPLTVVGVAAPGFRGVNVDRHADLWAPIGLIGADLVNKPGTHWIWILARRRPELSPNQLQSAVDVLMRQHLQMVYARTNVASFRKFAMAQRLEVRDGGIGFSMLREQFGKSLGVLLAAVALVLLASCINVANLLLARGAARRKEIAMRLSLGATRGRLVRQALAESTLLASSGCVLGALLAVWGQRYVVHFLPQPLGNPFGAGLDGRVLAFSAGISLLSALLFGLAPALRSTAVDPVEGLRSGGRNPGRPVLRRVLVSAQVALSVVLVLLAGLFGSSLAALRSVDLGFRHTNLIALQPAYPNKEARQPFLKALESLPGVVSAATAMPGPFQMGTSSASIRVPGSEKTASEPAEVAVHHVSFRYFETLGAKPLLGRDFQPSDPAGKAAIVNQEFVRQFLPGERQSIGRRLSFEVSKPEGGDPVFIVGVVRNIPHQGFREKIEPVVYWLRDDGDFALVRASVPPAVMLPALRKELARLGPQPAGVEPDIVRQRIDDSIFQDRLLAALSGFFGALALLLAAVGVYGVVAYRTLQRAPEIGLRIALGAERGPLLWLVLRDSLALAAFGLALGLPAAFAAARAARSLVFGVKPGDPWLFACTGLALLAVALAAAFLPARRAAAMDPMAALRQE